MRLDHLVHEIRWSNGTQVVQAHASGPSRPAASRHARRRPTMRDGRWGGAGAGRRNRPAAGTAPPPGPPGSRVPTTRASRTAPDDRLPPIPPPSRGRRAPVSRTGGPPRRRGPRGNYHHTKRRTRDRPATAPFRPGGAGRLKEKALRVGVGVRPPGAKGDRAAQAASASIRARLPGGARRSSPRPAAEPDGARRRIPTGASRPWTRGS